jgi:hypothetical protein
MRQIGFAALVLLSVAFAISARAQTSQTVSADDTARFLAGMPLSPDSPLSQLAQDPYVKQHAAHFDTAFGDIETNKLSKIRTWSNTHLTAPKPVMFYMFSGPDFLYADAFFPKATTYVLSGLEPTGSVPDVMKLPRGSIASALRNIQGSLRNILTLSYFITANMSQDLGSGPLNGTLPILYVFLARSGKTIHDVSLIHLDAQGALHPGEATSQSAPARGVKIVFSEKGGPQKTLYYFTTDLADQRNRNIALLEFCKSLGQGDSFVKSASYLLHEDNFSQARNFLLENSSLILQDDTGIPVSYFDAEKWLLRPFGRYTSPIPIFSGMYQTKLNELFQKFRPSPIDFGVGYRFRPNESNLMLAARIPVSPEMADSIAKDDAQRKAGLEPTAAAEPPDEQPAPDRRRVVGRADRAPRNAPIGNGGPSYRSNYTDYADFWVGSTY